MTKPTKRTAAINIKLDPQLYESFFTAAKLHAEIHGIEYKGGASTVRDLLREFVARVNSVKESANAQHAASVLRRRVRS